MQRIKINHGFTLIELMVTIAVMVIVATIAAPNMSKALDKRQIERTTTDFEKILIQARSDAVMSRKTITIHFGGSGKDTPVDRYWHIPQDVNLSFNVGTCSVGQWSVSIIPALSTIAFLPQGNVSALPANLEIKLTRKSDDRFIYLSNFGRISSDSKSAFEGSCT